MQPTNHRLAALILLALAPSCLATNEAEQTSVPGGVLLRASFPAQAEPVAAAEPSAPAPEPDWVEQVLSSVRVQPLPAPRGPLVSDPGSSPSLLDLFEQYGLLVDVQFLVDDYLRDQLQSIPAWVPASGQVAVEDVHPVVHAQLAENDIYLVFERAGPTPVVAVVSVHKAQRGSSLRTRATHVDVRDLVGFAEQRAFLLQTVLETPSLDVRQLSTSLRSLLTDTNTQNLVSAGTHSMVLQGPAGDLLQICRTLASVERLERGE